MAREKVEYDVIGRDVGGSKAFRDVGDAAGKAADRIEDAGAKAKVTGEQVEGLGDKTERAGEQADDAGEQYRGLAHDIERVQASVAALALEIDRTGNLDLVKDLERQRRELRKLTRVKDLLPDGGAVGAELAEQVSVSFVSRLGPLLARAPMGALNPAVAAIGAPIAAGIATTVGAAAAGAIVGGVGGLGVLGGVALAARHPEVKKQAEALGSDLGEILGRSSRAFVPEVLDGMGTIRARVADMEDDLTRAFTSASRHFDPLLDGLLDAGENALPGVIDAIDNAGPVIEAVADSARRFGDAVNDGLSDLADNADEGARALTLVLRTLEGGVRLAFLLLDGMAELYGKGEILGAVLTGNFERVAELATSNELAKRSSDDLDLALENLIGGLRDVGTEAITTEDAVAELKTAFDLLFDEEMGYDRAVIAYKEGIRELNKELREGKRSLSENTSAGLENRTAVLDQIERIKELRAARLAQGESLDSVNAKYGKDIRGLRSTLLQLGYNKTEVDALIGKYKAIPDLVATRVDADVIQAERELAKVRSLIAQIRSKKVVITTQHNQVVTRSEGRNVPISDGVGGRASGGRGAAGETYWVGERGPELLTFHRDGYVLNASQSAQIARQSLTQGAAVPGVNLDDFYRVLVRALQAAPIARLDSGRQADILMRTG